MRIYELILVLRSSVSLAQRKKLIDALSGWLKDFKIGKAEEKGEKLLAFKIKRELKGVYAVIELSGEVIPMDFEKRLLEREEVLTHLLLRKK